MVCQAEAALQHPAQVTWSPCLLLGGLTGSWPTSAKASILQVHLFSYKLSMVTWSSGKMPTSCSRQVPHGAAPTPSSDRLQADEHCQACET